MPSIKRDFAYNLILTVGNYIFPLLTYPYVSRVLGVNNIGICGYVDSVIDYFILFSTLGVFVLGIRETARMKHNKEGLTEVFSSLLTFNLLMAAVSVCILIGLTFSLPLFAPYQPFLLVGIAKIIFSALLIEWFYRGLSEFKYITIRSLIVRTIYVIAVFLFVRTPDDVFVYFTLTVMTTLITAFWNIWHSRRFVHFSLRAVHISLYIVPILSYGMYNILTSMYTSFNTLYLGSVTNEVQVGYFYTATKLHGICLSVFTAFTTVMIPRVSEMLAHNNKQEIQTIAGKTLDLVYMMTIPLIVFCCFFAPLIIRIIAGEGYAGAIFPFRIIIILLLIIGMEQIIIQQFLLTIKDSRCIIILSSIGAFVGVSTNLLLTPKWGAVGTSISWTLTEITLLFIASWFFLKHFQMRVFNMHLLKYLLASCPYVGICYLLHDNQFSWKLAIAIILMATWFLLLNLKMMPNQVLSASFHQLTNRISTWFK